VSPAPKKAAIDLDSIGDKRLSEISAADFLRVLNTQGGAAAQPPEELTVRDAIGLPEKKKLEREKFPGEKSIEKLWEGFPEKKKYELEKAQIEKPIEKFAPENFPEKKKVELEKPPGFEQVFDPTVIERLNTALTRIEAELAKRPQ
jgi:hypothetical protein